MAKQMELRGTIHRCLYCKRELRKPESIARRMGPRCYRMDKMVEKIYREGLCGKATGGVALGAQDVQ